MLYPCLCNWRKTPSSREASRIRQRTPVKNKPTRASSIYPFMGSGAFIAAGLDMKMIVHGCDKLMESYSATLQRLHRSGQMSRDKQVPEGYKKISVNVRVSLVEGLDKKSQDRYYHLFQSTRKSCEILLGG